MKVLCYFAIIVGFMMFYQKDPILTVTIIVIGVGVYIFFKSRKGKGGIVNAFFSGRSNSQDSKIDDLITLIILQQMFSTPSSNEISNGNKASEKNNTREEEIEKVKEEILTLLESD